MSASATQRHLPLPEPDLTPEEMIRRAIALQPRLRAEQEETERRGVHSPALDQEFHNAGFYRCIQPRRFGGYEFDLKTFYRLAIELARGDASAAWGVILGAGHALMLGSFFDADAQAAAFGPDGEFSAPSVAAPTGTATPVDGGWLIKGTWTYASGAPYATHFMPSVLIPGDDPKHPGIGLAVIPRSQWKMLDDWGAILGMRGSGSNSIRVDEARVPLNHVVRIDMRNTDLAQGTPGARLHNNPMYAGRSLSFFHAELVSILTGLGYAAIDEYEKIIRSRDTIWPPFTPRYQHHHFQRTLGLAIGMVSASRRLALDAGDAYIEHCRRGCAGGAPFSLEDDLELFASLEHAGRLVWEAIEMLFRTSGSSGAKNGERMQRYYRDASMYRTHISAQYDTVALLLAQVHLGLANGF